MRKLDLEKLFSVIHRLTKFFIFCSLSQEKDYLINIMPSFEYTDCFISIWKLILHVFSNTIIEITFSSRYRGMCYGRPKQKGQYSLLLRYSFIVLILKFWNQDGCNLMLVWTSNALPFFFLPISLYTLKLQKYPMLMTWPMPLLLLGLLKNVMTIHMLHKAGLTSSFLPGTCWLSARLIHLQNASSEISIFNFESLKHFRDSGFYSVVYRGIIYNLLHVKERTIDFPGKGHFSPCDNLFLLKGYCHYHHHHDVHVVTEKSQHPRVPFRVLIVKIEHILKLIMKMKPLGITWMAWSL